MSILIFQNFRLIKAQQRIDYYEHSLRVDNSYDWVIEDAKGEKFAWFNHNGDHKQYIEKGREKEAREAAAGTGIKFNGE